jgi:signal transduction histidine kinase
VQVSHDGLARFPQDTEAAVYFCVLEALQNIGKYAAASQVTIGLEAADGFLRFTVRDDGAGFEPGAAHGSGLTNMRDRLESLGGSLHLRSEPGRGTTVSGSIPIQTVT